MSAYDQLALFGDYLALYSGALSGGDDEQFKIDLTNAINANSGILPFSSEYLKRRLSIGKKPFLALKTLMT